MYFCPEWQMCSWLDNDLCTFECTCVTCPTDEPTAEPTPETTAEPTFKPTDEPTGCPPVGDNTLTYLPNPDDCSKFYQCINGYPVPMDCAPGLYFCTEKEVCDWSWDTDCTYDCIIVN
jgi:hypothetical protein